MTRETESTSAAQTVAVPLAAGFRAALGKPAQLTCSQSRLRHSGGILEPGGGVSPGNMENAALETTSRRSFQVSTIGLMADAAFAQPYVSVHAVSGTGT